MVTREHPGGRLEAIIASTYLMMHLEPSRSGDLPQQAGVRGGGGGGEGSQVSPSVRVLALLSALAGAGG